MCHSADVGVGWGSAGRGADAVRSIARPRPLAWLQAAYGGDEDCLGILFVRNVPGFAALRYRLLPLASAFATLPAEVRAKYERPDAVYSFGWSHGKEMFNGKPGATTPRW